MTFSTPKGLSPAPFQGDRIHRVYEDLLEKVHTRGELQGKTIDLLGVNLISFNPLDSFIFVKKQHWTWALAEMSDRLNPNFVNPGMAYHFRPTWKKKLAKEGGIFCYTYGEVYRKQLPRILKRLRSKSTREAIMTVWHPNHLIDDSYERTPCTLTLHFLIRDGALHLIVNMRTNDVINLLPYDLLHHMLLQRYVAAKMKLQLGQYRHNVGHVYYQKKRAATGNIERVLAELHGAELPEEFPGSWDFWSGTVDADMRLHYILLTEARKGLSVAGLSAIESSFVREWTAILIMAEQARLGEPFEYKFELPMFRFIHQLGYNLRRKR